jgi:hypothetical protein
VNLVIREHEDARDAGQQNDFLHRLVIRYRLTRDYAVCLQGIRVISLQRETDEFAVGAADIDL